jgi:hypothetical protein
VITGQQRLGIAASLIGPPAMVAGYVFWRSIANPANTIGASIFFGCMAAMPVFVIVLVAVGVMLRQKVIRVTVKMPESGRDDLLFEAMRATGFAFESERNATITFKQAGLQGLLSQIRLLVTKTPDGFVVVGQPGFVERALRFLGGAVVHRE